MIGPTVAVSLWVAAGMAGLGLDYLMDKEQFEDKDLLPYVVTICAVFGPITLASSIYRAIHGKKGK